MNLFNFKDLFIYLTSISSTALSIFSLTKNESKKKSKVKRTISIFVIILSIISAGLNLYISSYENSLTSGSLMINVANPVIVNYNGTEKDAFIKDADFLVVGETGIFAEYTEIKLTNLKTNQKYEYETDTIYNGFSVNGLRSGTYKIEISCDQYPTYINTIVLNTKNLQNGSWDFTAYYFDYFYSNAKPLNFTITDTELKKIEYNSFTIATEECDKILIFRSEIIDNKLKGEFYALPEKTYKLANAISPTEFEAKEIYLE